LYLKYFFHNKKKEASDSAVGIGRYSGWLRAGDRGVGVRVPVGSRILCKAYIYGIMRVQDIGMNDKHAHILMLRKESEILRNKGCIDNLAILTTEAFEERNTVSALFLDIISAYDNVHCGTLIDRLKDVSF
jgi:hypothetical protein